MHLFPDVETGTNCLLIIFLHRAPKCWRKRPTAWQRLGSDGAAVVSCTCVPGNFKVSGHISLGCLLYSHFSPVSWVFLSPERYCQLALAAGVYCLESTLSTFSTIICLWQGVDKSLKLHPVWLCLDVSLSFTHARDCRSGLLTGHCACRLSLDWSSLLSGLSFIMHRASLSSHLWKACSLLTPGVEMANGSISGANSRWSEVAAWSVGCLKCNEVLCIVMSDVCGRGSGSRCATSSLTKRTRCELLSMAHETPSGFFPPVQTHLSLLCMQPGTLHLLNFSQKPPASCLSIAASSFSTRFQY